MQPDEMWNLPEGFIEKTDSDDLLLYADTDSCIGTTQININDKKVSIDTFYHDVYETEQIISENNFIKKLHSDYYSRSVSKKLEIENKRVKYIMKHKVKKRMFKIIVDDDEVVLTADHSLIVFRNNELIESKPSDVKINDRLFKVFKSSTLVEYENFAIEDLGIQEEWVYDIEVEDNHNFFANNILVHNSAYLLYDLPFDKYENIYQLVDYVQRIAKELGVLYNNALEYYMSNIGLNPEYNTMDFKSEVIAYKGFFNTKKFYALAKAWDEGVYFEKGAKLKITGGQIKKSDVTQLTKSLLTDIYDVLVMDLEQVNLQEMKRIIFHELKNKYKLQIQQDIQSMNFQSFSIPKKWGNTKKSVPPFVTGAMLFNAIIEDTFRPSDSFIVVKIRINLFKLTEYFKENQINENEFTLQYHDVLRLKEKINVISIPPEMSQEKKDKLINIMKQLDIKLNYNDIVDSNIDSKLLPYEKLFKGID